MIDWYKKVIFDNYANFSGRARRSEYWYFVLVDFFIQMFFLFFIMMFVGASMFSEEAAPIGFLGIAVIGIYSLYSLGTFIPRLAVIVRRLHDTGKSGWCYLLGFIPVVGPILLLVWFATEGNPFDNNWGKNPKAEFSDIDQIAVSNRNY